MADFDALLAEAHRLGLKVMIDFVPSHTSDQHPWFLESRQSRDNPKADWYVWADAKPDGNPPNNWLAVFGGSTWEWESRRGQYYLHNFLKEQPDLNFHNPQVIEALLGQARFWLERGVDGFRCDAIDFGVHDPQPAQQPGAPAAPGRRRQRAGLAVRDAGPGIQQGPAGAGRAVPEAAARADRALRRQGAAGRDQPATTRCCALPSTPMAAASTWSTASTCWAAPARPRTSAPSSSGWRRRSRDGWGCWSFSNHDVRRVGHPLGRRRRARGAAPPGARPARLAARLGLPLPGRGAGPGGGRARLRAAQGSVRHHLLAGLQGPRRLPHADALGGVRARSRLLRRPSPGCRSPRATAAAPSTCSTPTRTPCSTPPAPSSTGAASASRSRPARIKFVRSSGDVLAFERYNNDRLLCLFNLGGTDADIPRLRSCRLMPASTVRVSRSRVAR